MCGRFVLLTDLTIITESFHIQNIVEPGLLNKPKTVGE
jgi:hypothetical protein